MGVTGISILLLISSIFFIFIFCEFAQMYLPVLTIPVRFQVWSLDSKISITWVLARNAHSQAPPCRPIESEIQGLGPGIYVLTSLQVTLMHA